MFHLDKLTIHMYEMYVTLLHPGKCSVDDDGLMLQITAQMHLNKLLIILPNTASPAAIKLQTLYLFISSHRNDVMFNIFTILFILCKHSVPRCTS